MAGHRILALEDLAIERHSTLGGERHVAVEHLVNQHAQRPQVDLVAMAL